MDLNRYRRLSDRVGDIQSTLSKSYIGDNLRNLLESELNYIKDELDCMVSDINVLDK